MVGRRSGSLAPLYLPCPGAPCSMQTSALVLSLLALLAAPACVHVINMCEEKSWVMGRAFLNITSYNMGRSVRCNCTLRAKTLGRETTTHFKVMDVDSNLNNCQQSSIFVHPFEQAPLYENQQNFTCSSKNGSKSDTGRIHDEVMIVLKRMDASVAVSYCFFVFPYNFSENDLELSCQNDRERTSPPPPTTRTSPSTPATTTPISTSRRTSSLTSSTTTTVRPNPTTMTAKFVPQPRKVISTSSMTSSSATSEDGVTTTSRVTTSNFITTPMRGLPPQDNTFLFWAILGGSLAAVTLISIAVIISVCLCRRKSSSSQPSPEDTPKDPQYATLDDVTGRSLDPDYDVMTAENRDSLNPVESAETTSNRTYLSLY